ncbi:helix-turn-helix transcriptional regulator [Bradyrhizobium sp.]|uniref:ArsR/SmtB family transcription factor n=1 Tax=Bradyrhizobium sp. TaxID=376 RepID=UPI002D22BF8B|nr:helix-turn-helix transcriptional regulator [Bradyrhizobium sp.]HZR73477.1 helix-turn-helix transcriptional regulator [Bradyrhizobium sp.]
MKNDAAARIFAELGNVTRLDILRLLITAGREGLSIGDIRAQLKIPLSTLSFHLRGLLGAGLIEQKKLSRIVLCRPCFDAINEAIAFLRTECCAKATQPSADRKAAA